MNDSVMIDFVLNIFQSTFLTFPKLTEDVYRLYTLVFNLRYSVQQYNLYFFYIFLGGKV